MKSIIISCFRVIVVTALVVQTTSQYNMEAQYRQNFGLPSFPMFSVLQRVSPSQFNSLSSKVSLMEGSLGRLNLQLTSLTSQLSAVVSQLTAQIASLRSQATLLIPKCPTFASSKGGQVVGTMCYVVTVNSLKYTEAQTGCTNSGGVLAEPPPVSAFSQEFYSKLREKFPSQIRTIEASSPPQIWIGYIQTTANSASDALKAASGSGIFAPVLTPIILSNAPFGTAPANLLAAAIVGPTGATWFAANSVTATLPAYICQYNTV